MVKSCMTRVVRFHVAVGVSNLEKSRAFYTEFFQTGPTRETHDQFDWILDDPPVNFSIFYNPEREIGPEHFGLDFPVEEVAAEISRLRVKDFHLLDPDGIRVEVFSSDKRD